MSTNLGDGLLRPRSGMSVEATWLRLTNGHYLVRHDKTGLAGPRIHHLCDEDLGRTWVDRSDQRCRKTGDRTRSPRSW